MADAAYSLEFNEAPFSYLSLVALNRDTNRGARITSISSEKESNEPYCQIKLPAKIVSINGERCTKYVFRNIEKLLSNSNQLPILIRFEDYNANESSNNSNKIGKHSKNQSSIDVTTSQSDNEGSYVSHRPQSASIDSMKRTNQFKSNNSNNHRRTKSSIGRGTDNSNAGGRYGAYNVGKGKKKNKHMRSESFADDSSFDSKNNLAKNTRKLRNVTSQQPSPEFEQCCIKCFKFLKGKKKHYCRRCGELVCGKCSKNKRREAEYAKLVRVCDVCVERDEFVCQIQSRPFGLSMTPLQGTNDSMGALIIKVKPNSSAYNARVESNSVIIELNNENIEHLTYKQVVERLHGINCPFNIRLKRWNDHTKNSAKEKLKERLISPTLTKSAKNNSNESLSNGKNNRKKPGSAQSIGKFDDDSNVQMFGVSQSQTSPASSKFAISDDHLTKREKNKHNKSNSSNSSNSNGQNRNGNNNMSMNGHKRNDSQLSDHSVHSRQDSGNSMSYEESFVSQNSDEKLDELNQSTGQMISESNASLRLENESSFDLSNLDSYQQFVTNAINYENSKKYDLARDSYDKAINFVESQIIQHRDNLTDEQYSNYTKLTGDWKVKILRLEKKVKHQKRLERENNPRSNSYSSNNNNNNNTGNNGNNSSVKPKGNKKNSNKEEKTDIDSAFRERLEADIVADLTGISFQDVQGLDNVKLALYETVILPQKRPELFTGLRSPGMGILLFGPPGNGKTMIAKCVAAQCNSTFFSISASSITSKYVGEAERIMRTLFSLARERAPSIIFIDEIDSLLTARGGKNEAESSRRIKTEFLIQFDGVHNSSELNASLLVIGATNLPQQLDEAVLRRFSKRILVPEPERVTRYGLLRHLMSRENHQLTEGDFQKISKHTERYSCSDLRNLCADASMGPVRDLGANLANKDLQVSEIPKISIKHFENAMKNVRSSLSKDSLEFYYDWNKKFGSKFNLQNTNLPKEMQAKQIPIAE